ncbi:MAG: hypothetical protein PHI97_28565 [Desulfobulbus sp.]|nr:hypothetical protein [Desulfobulbus sp.]
MTLLDGHYMACGNGPGLAPRPKRRTLLLEDNALQRVVMNHQQMPVAAALVHPDYRKVILLFQRMNARKDGLKKMIASATPLRAAIKHVLGVRAQ